MKLRVMHAWVVIAAMSAGSAVAMYGPTHAYSAPPPKPQSPLASQAKAVTDAKTALDKAKAALLPIRRKVEAVFDIKPEFKAAKAAMEKAKADSDAAAKKVTQALEKTPDYIAMVAKRDKSQAILDASSKPAVAGADDTAKISDEDISNATRDRYAAGTGLKKMEKEAQDADPAYGLAQQKYVEARTTWDAMQTQIDDAVKLDPAYPALQKDIEAAEARYKQARDAYAAAQKTSHPVRR